MLLLRSGDDGGGGGGGGVLMLVCRYLHSITTCSFSGMCMRYMSESVKPVLLHL